MIALVLFAVGALLYVSGWPQRLLLDLADRRERRSRNRWLT